MKRIAFFDTKPYDKEWFDRFNNHYEIDYFEGKLMDKSAPLAAQYDGVIAFVNDDVNKSVIDTLAGGRARVLALRCAGYNNVDIKHAAGKLTVVRVPYYSPYSVAEHAMAMLLTLNRRLHKAYNRTRDFNFSLNGLTGSVLRGKTVGVIGTGRIGRAFVEICSGFGLKVICYDPYPADDKSLHYVTTDEIFKNSDVISLHCPLNKQSYHMINKDTIGQMKKGAYIINTSRGGLIDSEALLEALNSGKLGGAALDVYEEESEYFFEDMSTNVVRDEVLSLLVSRPNVLITSHQAFLTDEALENIAQTTLNNLDMFFAGKRVPNEVVYNRADTL